MPKRKDKFGNRFGFVTLSNNKEARKLLLKKDVIIIEGSKLVIDWARSFKKFSTTPVFSTGHQEKTSNKTRPQSKVSHPVSVENLAKSTDSDIIHLTFESSWREELNRSFTVHTFEDFGADYIMELLISQGFS